MWGGTRRAAMPLVGALVMDAAAIVGTVVVGAVVVGVLPMPAAGAVPAVAAANRQACAFSPAAGQAALTAVPSAQLRYSPARLNRLADGAGIRIAVIDSGVDDSHPQLRGRVLPGRDFLQSGPDGRQDCVGHGTAVAGIMVAGIGTPGRAAQSGRGGLSSRNGKPDAGGLRGLAPAATVVPIRVSERIDVDGEPTGATVSGSRLARAIDWAADKDKGNATVVNMSLAMTEDDPSVRAAVRAAIAAGVVVVAAVGNQADKGNPVPYPAAYPGVIGVGAVGPQGWVQPYSQRGAYVDLVAPGGGVAVVLPGGGYRLADGTSYAAPFVAATAALIQQRFPGISPAEVARRLKDTADPTPGGLGNDAYGSGLLNPYRALTEALPAAAGQPVLASRPLAVHPAGEALQRRRAHARAMALSVAGGSAVLLVVVTALAVIVPSGRRRRWLPGGPVGRA